MRLPYRLWAASLIPLVWACGDDATEEPAFAPKATIPQVGSDPLAAKNLESCPVYLEETCESGVKKECAIYDTAAGAFVDDPDSLVRRVFLYDRWYDLYSSPMGLTGERYFVRTASGSLSEAEWSSMDMFERWGGMGDSAIWTGAALNSDIFRYAVTNTDADYERMEGRIRALLSDFEATGIPGYLARHHSLIVPPGSPKSDKLVLRYGEFEDFQSVDMPIENLDADGLPPEYKDGIPDPNGGRIMGTPIWDGDVSIDQYTGPMTTFPIAYALLKDEKLKERMVYHLTCYLKRLQRIEVTNLKAKPDLVEELKAVFGGTSLNLDPDDPDINDLSELVWYVHRGINRNNADGFDRTCPDTVQYEPWRVIDARSPTFESEILELATDINREIRTRDNQIDHFYIPTLRGGDASHLMHLAAMAYYFTQDEQYKTFLFDELIGNLRANDVARTMMAFRLPDWCFKFYGDHITYGTHWQLITLLPDGALKDEMIRVMEEEAWQKALYNHNSAKFNVMYASVVPDEIASDRQGAIDSALAQLRSFGGNDGVMDAPRRNYTRDRKSIIDALPSNITTRCPTEEERARCEEAGTIFGFELESEIISRECDGRAGECMMEDGLCTDALASEGLPMPLRRYGDFVWQRHPFQIGEDNGAGSGHEQSPGRDLTEPYWMARYYHLIPEGDGQVLAWKENGSCN